MFHLKTVLCHSCTLEFLLEHKCNDSNLLLITETCSEPSQASKMKLFMEINKSFQALIGFAKSLILDFWVGAEYGSEFAIFLEIVRDARGPVFDFIFNHRILMLMLMGFTHVLHAKTKAFFQVSLSFARFFHKMSIKCCLGVAWYI